MKTKKYITQNLLLLFAAGWLICSTFSCANEDIPDNSAPKLIIQEVSNALRTSAVFSGSISGETDNLKDFGFEYSTSKDFPTDQTTQVSMLESGASSALTTQVKGLSPSTLYYYRMYATTGATTIYSEERPFNTASMSGPQLSDLVTDSIGERYARFKFSVEDYGNEVLIECGVSYKKSDTKTFIPVACEKITEDDQYTIELTDLEPDTEYEFRAYAKNAADKEASTGSIEGYGAIVKQRTAALLSANIETIDEVNIKITSVNVTGIIKSAVGSNGVIDECGFVYSKTNDLPTYNSDFKVVHHPEKNINVSEQEYRYNEDITDLLQETHYYIRAYAKNTVEGEERIAYGATREITTLRLDKPEVELDYHPYECTATKITVRASIRNYDANALKEKGFIWSRSQGELSIEDAKKVGTYKAVTNGDYQFEASIDSLEMASEYYIRAYAIYKSGDLTETGYSGSRTFSTEGFNLPSLGIEINPDKVTFNSAELVGKIPNPGNTKITERGFVLSTQSPEVTLEDCDKKVTSDDSFITTVTGLKYQTSYYVRAYAKCELGGKSETAYSGYANFHAPDFDRPSFSDMSISSSLHSLTMTTSIKAGKDGTILSRGFCAIKEGNNTPEPTINDLKVEEAVTSGGTYTLEIKDLTINTTYQVRAYAIVQLGDEKITCYGSTSWVNTEGFRLPSLGIEINQDKVTFNSAELVGKIPDPGNTGITERGFVLSTQFPQVTLENCEKVITSDEEFITTVTGLKYQTHYYVRAYAKCKLGEKIDVAYSGWDNINTPDFDRPLFSDMSISSSLNSLAMTISIAAGKDGTILSRGFCAIKRGNDTPEPTINDLKVEEAVTSTSGITYTLEIKSLPFNTSYKVRAYAIVQLGDEKITCYSPTYWTETQNLSANAGFKTTDTKCEAQVTITSNVDLSKATEYGFAWTDSDTWETSEITNNLPCSNMGTDKKFSGTIEGLTGGKKYYVWIYVTIDGKTNYVGRWEFTTKRIPGQGDNVSPDKKQ